MSICKLNTWNNLTRKDFKTIPVIESNIQFKKKFRLETRYRQKLESGRLSNKILYIVVAEKV
ncbi:hypothetical protein BV917_15060 [Leptospira santarosai serovar Guaricura]|nr:hypothetical protein BV917_15060 [Leptospira santarosai serovar Guaricura]